MRGGGDGGDEKGDRGFVDGLVSSAQDPNYGNDNVLVLDHAVSDFTGLHGGPGGSTNATYSSTSGYFDMASGMMASDASGNHHGGSYSLQQGELPTGDTTASGHHQVYYDETNSNIML